MRDQQTSAEGITTADDLQVLENALKDTSASTVSRGRLLRTAALGAASVGALGVTGSALAASKRGSAGVTESPRTILSTLATAESFGVTFLTQVIRTIPGTPAEKAGLVDTLRAANTAEYDHVVWLRRLGGRQTTLKFWIPDALFGGGGVGLFESIETADTVELMGYLTGVTSFAKRGNERATRFLAEAAAIESEHRALARFAQTALGGRKQIAIDRSFAPWSIKTVEGMIKALEGAGIGFGEQSSAPGKFYDFPGDPVANGTGMRNNGRRPA
jgi:hypothetical protein